MNKNIHANKQINGLTLKKYITKKNDISQLNQSIKFMTKP